MARIRSIKPEFWTDGKIRRLGDTTALFFIALWNHCDDAGYFELDTLELASRTGRWRSQDIMRMLWALHGASLVRLSTGDERVMELSSSGHGVGMVTSWSHQRIDKPRPSKWKDVDIQWDDAPPIRERSKIIPRKERIGEDRRGEDRIPHGTEPQAVAVSAPKSPKKIEKEKTKGNELVAAYCEAYKSRYGVYPIVQGASAGAAKRLSQGPVPISQLVELVRVYLTMDDQWFLTKRHDLAIFEQNLNAVKIKAETGASISRKEAQLAESADFHKNQLARIVGGAT